MPSRRRFLRLTAAAPLVPVAAGLAAEPATPGPCALAQILSLNGSWWFLLDPKDSGLAGAWHRLSETGNEWRRVTVPHTWQIEPETTDYMGVGWYRRDFEVPASWSESTVRVEFEAVFHSATVWVNGAEAGQHRGKGYTAFTCDIGRLLQPGKANTIVVRADNSYDESMLPRGRSSDWAHDGGIYRPVQLLITPKVYIESIAVDSDPDLTTREATVEIAATLRNTLSTPWNGNIGFRVIDDDTGLAALSVPAGVAIQLAPGETKTVKLPAAKLREPRLWHFDHPHLYRLALDLSNGHTLETTFGVRKIETRNGAFFLNGEKVRLMGAERMAGSNPEYGMAEPGSWIDHDHADMKELNCVYTRVHWQQDRRLLDWCDRHGMLIQTEVPTWGLDTFKGMVNEPSPGIMNNGLEQLREMIGRDRNHPCIFSWGVCNEIGGQNPPAYAFAKRMLAEAKSLDPKRLVTYASNTLQETPAKDVVGLMDYIMWNEYYESWYAGGPADMSRNLDEIHAAFPGKAIVISEYGYCACTADRPEGDGKRIEVLREHDRIFRERDYVAGLIFFCYNDYRTHIGDRGTGVAKQRVHGVVDVYGGKKKSWEVLRRESSPLESVRVSGAPPALQVAVRSRNSVPSYTLRDYQIRGIAYGFGDTPVERVAARLETLAPGAGATVSMAFTHPGITRIQVDIMRPTGSSVWTEVWQY